MIRLKLEKCSAKSSNCSYATNNSCCSPALCIESSTKTAHNTLAQDSLHFSRHVKGGVRFEWVAPFENKRHSHTITLQVIGTKHLNEMRISRKSIDNPVGSNAKCSASRIPSFVFGNTKWSTEANTYKFEEFVSERLCVARRMGPMSMLIVVGNSIGMTYWGSTMATTCEGKSSNSKPAKTLKLDMPRQIRLFSHESSRIWKLWLN